MKVDFYSGNNYLVVLTCIWIACMRSMGVLCAADQMPDHRENAGFIKNCAEMTASANGDGGQLVSLAVENVITCVDARGRRTPIAHAPYTKLKFK